MTLLNKILDFADEYGMFPGSGLVIACVSGGADSMCLLEALTHISRSRGFTVCAAHYNHRLRGEESMRDEEFVREYCQANDVPFYLGSGDVMAHAKQSGTGIEEAARDMRYGFFYDTAAATGAVRIATAHTADDNAETLLMNLARGAGANGLSGIPPKRGMVIRPMLQVSRDEILAFLGKRGVMFVEDSTNSYDICTRNKIRHVVMPVLREINPRFNEAAAVTSELSRADEEYLSALAEEYSRLRKLDARTLLELPLAISGRVIRKLCGRGASYRHVKAVLELCKQGSPSSKISLPGMTVYREYDKIIFAAHTAYAHDSFEPVYLKEGESAVIPGLALKISCKIVQHDDTINKSFTSFLFKHTDVYGKISVRPRREGDIIRFFSQNSTKSLKKLFIERRIPVRDRALIPVIADDKGVLAVYGIGMGDRAVPEPGGLAFQVIFEEI